MLTLQRNLMSEKYKYTCPKCSAGLSQAGEVMLTMTRTTGEKTNNFASATWSLRILLQPTIGFR